MNNQTFHKQNESRIRLLILAKLLPWLFIGLILIIGLIRDCSGSDVDPMDNSYMKNIGVVDHVFVVDSTRNGFRTVYTTVKPVTDARLQEIRKREKSETLSRGCNTTRRSISGDHCSTPIFTISQFLPSSTMSVPMSCCTTFS